MGNKLKSKQIVLVALTGSLASTVAAYLMKKQGHRVIGVSVQWFDTQESKDIYSSWHLNDLGPIKAICDHLDIEFYGVHGSEVFYAEVEEYIIAQRLAGEALDVPLKFHTAFFRLLIAKANKLKADKVCTGHLAKITINQSTGQYNVVTAQEIEHDQSYLLSRLGNQELSMIELPLAEMKLSQIKKIAEIFPFEFKNLKTVTKSRKVSDQYFDQYFRSRVPSNLIKAGQFISFEDGDNLGEHDGHHMVELGGSHLHDKENTSFNSHLTAIEVNAFNGSVCVERDDLLEFDHINLHRMTFAEGVDFSRPFEVFVLTPLSSNKIAAFFLPKNHHFGVLHFQKTTQGFLPKGKTVYIYNKEGSGGKLLGSGEVLEAGVQHDDGLKIRFFPEVEDDDMVDEEEIKERERLKEFKRSKGARF